MANVFTLLDGILNLRMLFLALGLIAVVLVAGYASAKNKKTRRKAPGQYLRYRVPGKTAAACRGALDTNGQADTLTYGLQASPRGGWFFHITGYRPTQQITDTTFLLQFEGDDPAILTLEFLGEAFGMKEPLVGEALLDEFFAAKLGAEHLPHSE